MASDRDRIEPVPGPSGPRCGDCGDNHARCYTPICCGDEGRRDRVPDQPEPDGPGEPVLRAAVAGGVVAIAVVYVGQRFTHWLAGRVGMAVFDRVRARR